MTHAEKIRSLFADRDGRPLLVSDGMGVDSTALLELLAEAEVRPDAILFADTGAEKDETYEYLPVRRARLASLGFPDLTVVRYVVSDFKHWPPYEGLDQNCLTNGTLPSLAFGFKSCSQKWKIKPQDRWGLGWEPAKATWAAGRKVLKTIGYDASPNDKRRFAHAEGMTDPAYQYEYPLLAAGIDREGCKAVIRNAGQPEPVKSACYMCPATQPEELHTHKRKYLRWIVIMEARAQPRLTDVLGLWRNGVKGTRGGKAKPGRMTDYIRQHGLLPSSEIDELIKNAPAELIDQQQQFANGMDIPSWREFLDSFSDPGDVRPTPPAAAQFVPLGRKRTKAS